MSAHDDFTSTPDAAAAYEQAHGERDEYKPAFPLGSGNVPRRLPCGCWGQCTDVSDAAPWGHA